MGGKKIKGRKRHIVTDTQGHLLYVQVHAAHTHDTVSGCPVFKATLEKYPSLKGVCADAGYRKTMVDFVEKVLKKTIVISERIAPGWAVLAKRWVVERTFAWFESYRRLSKDFEYLTDTSEVMIQIAMIRLMLNRIKN